MLPILSNKFTAVTVLLVGFIAFLCVLGPWWSVYEIFADEGINLQKAVLLAQGERLYADIWSDQPPILHWVLAVVQSIFPFSITAARITILFFSCILAVSLFQVVYRYEGLLAAWASVLFLVSAKLFLTLSVSIAIGLPAVALAMLSLNVATCGNEKTRPWFAFAAGSIFAAATLTKMFVLIALPALLAAFWIVPSSYKSTGWINGAKALLWFLLGALLVVGSVFLIVEGFYSDQLFSPHLTARAQGAFAKMSGPTRLYEILKANAALPLFTAFLLGIPAFTKNYRSALLVPVIWVLVGFWCACYPRANVVASIISAVTATLLDRRCRT